ncbi:disintegrin and metalloproteinase domain-containing protein 15 isoform X2 [Ambystoma mexicanum]|uniref:disintegrin and metalloproteinase domain-containing protein 15 isoform X2 n=1 Tax=Ambystoma mexicanum TaxID=8296 RepID=UPI0037E9A653
MELVYGALIFCWLYCTALASAPQSEALPPLHKVPEQEQPAAPETMRDFYQREGGASQSSSQQEETPPFTETVPWVLLEGQRVPLQEALKVGHPSQLFIVLEIEGDDYEIELKQNKELLQGGHSLVSYLPDGRPVTKSAEKPVNCYYHTRVLGLPHSRGSVSTCSGIRGTLFLSGSRSYSITPVADDPNGRHLLSKIPNASGEKQPCGARYGQPVMPSEGHRPRLRRLRRNVLSEMKYIELVIVADQKEYKNYYSDMAKLQQRMLEIANQVDEFYQPLNVRVVLVGLEVWNRDDQILVGGNLTDTLNRFLAWRQTNLLPRMPHDNAQLLRGAPFKGPLVGMASQASMCTPERSGGVIVDHSVSILSVASTMAHELGHNLGMSHDTDDRRCMCPRSLLTRRCIMESSSGFLSGLAFSNCSKSDLERNLLQGGGMCLFNVPEAKNLKRQICGNLFLEEGEECDCGLAEECKDPCCNATVCKLVPGAECSSIGMCCEDCKLKNSGSLCRVPLGECDLPEYCNGVSPYCPENIFLQNGQPCKSGQAYCYSGDCRSYDSQCQTLWGPGSSQAPDVCFNTVNAKGDKYGNCGQAPNGSFVSCDQRNTKCGKIQCQGGRYRPILGSNAEIVIASVTVNQTKFNCRGTYYNLGDDITDPAMVLPGSTCGEGKVCLDRKCQNVSVLGVQECNSKCNAHGVCNSNGNCHCDDGWGPPDCKSAGPGGSIDSGPQEQRSGVSGLTTALLILFLLVLPLAALLTLCCLKRTILQKMLANLSKGTGCQRSEGSAETRVRFLGDGASVDRPRYPHSGSRPTPERPRPPQRGQSTELQVMPIISKPIFQASDRPDPPSKPLPPDPVPKRVQPQLSTKPPVPPKKFLHSRPISQTDGELPSSVPTYHPQVIAFPPRPAPPPPSGLAEDTHIQT